MSTRVSLPQQFSISYDKLTKIVTGIVLAIGITLPLALFQLSFVALGLFVLMATISAIAYAMSPRSYTVTNGEIRVERLIDEIVVPLENMTRASSAEAGELSSAIRVAGSGGMFGYYGLFRTSKLGISRWFVTNRANAAVVRANGKAYVFSPDDVPGFVDAVRAAAPLVTADLPQPGFFSYVSWKSFAGVVGALVFTGLLIYVVSSWSPGPPSYSFAANALQIHDRFYAVTLPVSTIEVDQARVVDLAVDKEWRPTMRTNGFANSHYRSGHFRVVGGQSVRLYQAESRKLVLLPMKSGQEPVLLQVPDPDAFLAELRNHRQ